MGCSLEVGGSVVVWQTGCPEDEPPAEDGEAGGGVITALKTLDWKMSAAATCTQERTGRLFENLGFKINSKVAKRLVVLVETQQFYSTGQI